MFQWIVEKVRPIIQQELAKFKTEIGTLIQDGMAVKGIKAGAYAYLDGILAEGQSMSKDRLDAWWIQKRAQLKVWAGQAVLVLLLLGYGHAAYAQPVLSLYTGTPLESENVDQGYYWEMRGGIIKFSGIDYLHETSWGFSNYVGEAVPAPSRLVPGDLAFRTLNVEQESSFRLWKFLSLKVGGGIGWTWIAHSQDSKHVTLADLEPYGPEDKLISVSERVHDNFSATFKVGLDYLVSDSMSLNFGTRYLFLHSTRTRDVLLYDEGSTASYNDRYYTHHSESLVSFDSWTLMAGVKFYF